MFTVDVANAIATVTLNRPPVNAISEEWLLQFNEALDALERRADWKVLLLRSAQSVFCAGADLKEMHARMNAEDGPDRAFSFVAGIQRLYARIESVPQVSIAEIGGAAMGGGFELALSCDLRAASTDAKFGLPEARLGLIPGAGGTQRLTRLCGRGVAARLILGAEIVDGETARALGIVHWAVPRADLPKQAAELALRVADLPAKALAASKRCLALAEAPGRDGYVEELEATRHLLSDAETRQRVDAFFAKRSDRPRQLERGTVS